MLHGSVSDVSSTVAGSTLLFYRSMGNYVWPQLTITLREGAGTNVAFPTHRRGDWRKRGKKDVSYVSDTFSSVR